MPCPGCGTRAIAPSPGKPSHHQIALQTLPKTLGLDADSVIVLDTLREQRNLNDHEGDPVIDAPLRECLAQAEVLLAHTRRWLESHQPDLLAEKPLNPRSTPTPSAASTPAATFSSARCRTRHPGSNRPPLPLSTSSWTIWASRPKSWAAAAGAYAKYCWAKLMAPGMGGFEVLALYSEAIQKMNENPGVPALFRDMFKNAFLPYSDRETLRIFLKQIDGFIDRVWASGEAEPAAALMAAPRKDEAARRRLRHSSYFSCS